MITFPNAKINIGLNIESKRLDGYHNISTIFYPIPLCDAIEILPSATTNLYCYGNKVDCPVEKNLVMKAYRLMAEKFNLPNVDIHLYKHIPDGAGLGGGSSDASSVALMINDMFGLGLTKPELAAIVKTLGADCSFFVYNTPMIARGIGDDLSPIPLSLNGYKIVVIKPNVSVSTSEAYAGVTPHSPDCPIENLIYRPITEWEGSMVNDFEQTIFATHPELSAIKDSFYEAGAVYASMSGSGSAIYGIFEGDKLSESFVKKYNSEKLFIKEL